MHIIGCLEMLICNNILILLNMGIFVVFFVEINYLLITWFDIVNC